VEAIGWDLALEWIVTAKYFTKMNIQWGYNNVRIKDGDEWKLAFQMNQGLFKL